MIPAVIFAVLQVLDDLRLKSWTACITGIILLLGFVVMGAFIRAKFMLSRVFIIIPYAVLFFILYTVFLMASIEKENEVWYATGLFTLESSLVYILLALLTGATFSRTLYVKLPMLMRHEYIISVWDFLFLVPMFMTILMWWSIPVRPDLAMDDRLRLGALIFLWLTLLLYYVFWLF